jgi:hypothetical protein
MRQHAVVGADGLELMQAKLRLLAVDVVKANPRGGWVPDVADAIGLATELVAADQDTPATVAVASLDRGVSFAETRELVCEMLTELGMNVSSIDDGDVYAIRIDAFERGLLNASDIEGPFYDRLVEWDSQGPLDRALVVLFDERDHETDPARRATIEERMRAAVRAAQPAD